MTATESRQERARALRARVDAQPDGVLLVERDELLELLAPPPADEVDDDEAEAAGERDPVRYAQGLLAGNGLATRPPLRAAGDAEQVRVVPSARYAVQGAVAVGILLTIAGLVGYWVYGLSYAVATGVAAVAVGVGFDRLRRALPAAAPRGRLLGAAAAVLAALIVTAAVVVPVRHHRKDFGKARGLVIQADAAIDRGRLDLAKNDLFAAQSLIANPPLIDDVRAHLVVAEVQQALDRQSFKEGLFDEAERAAAARDYRRAISLMGRLRGFRNANQRLAAFRAAERRAARRGR